MQRATSLLRGCAKHAPLSTSSFVAPSLRSLVGGVAPDQASEGLAARASAYSALDVQVEADGVATVLLNRPAKQNALDIPMWAELIDCFASASADSAVRVAVLRGAGGHLCSGMDLSVFAELKTLYDEEPCSGRRAERARRAIRFFQAGVSAPELCTKPVIGLLEGNVVGGGVDLVTACDLRYAEAGAKISVKEVDLAIVADVGTMQRLPHLVGDQRARELTFTGRTFGGQEAARYGLALECFGGVDEMVAHAYGVARAIAAKSPLTVRGIKVTGRATAP